MSCFTTKSTISRVVQDSARSDQPYKSFTNWLTFQNFVRGQIFALLILLDEEAESLRYFFGAKLHAYTCAEKYYGRSPRALKCRIKKVTKIVTELPETQMRPASGEWYMKLVIELYHSGGGSGNNVVRIWFRWSGLTQKRAQSTGNHTERLWKKYLDQKVILEKS